MEARVLSSVFQTLCELPTPFSSSHSAYSSRFCGLPWRILNHTPFNPEKGKKKSLHGRKKGKTTIGSKLFVTVDFLLSTAINPAVSRNTVLPEEGGKLHSCNSKQRWHADEKKLAEPSTSSLLTLLQNFDKISFLFFLLNPQKISLISGRHQGHRKLNIFLLINFLKCLWG